MTPSFLGTVRDGKLFLDNTDKFKGFLHTLNEKRVEVTVGKLKHPRTNQQNKYYWGCVVAEIAQHTGHDPEQIHEFLKLRFSPRWFLTWPVGPQQFESQRIPTSTTRLDTLAFVEYTEKCRMWANEFLGLQIPLPGEVSL